MSEQTNENITFYKRQLEISKSAARNFKSAAPERELFDALPNNEIFEAANADRVEIRRSIIEPSDDFGIERILGDNDLLPFYFFQLGLKCGQSVCRIVVREPNGRPVTAGTGFMISPTLLMTNHHILPNKRLTIKSKAQFGFEVDLNFDEQPGNYYKLDSDKFFYNHENLDFALIAVEELSQSGTSLSNYGHLNLISTSGKALTKEKVSMIQHPEGRAKHIAIRDNKILNLKEDKIHYETDSKPGSSGSPVFNDHFDVVALHRSGVPKVNDQDEILKKDGTIFQEGDSREDVVWIANEGVRISSIFQHVKSRNWSANEVLHLKEAGFEVENDSIESVTFRTSSLISDRAVPVTLNNRISLEELIKILEDPNTTEEEIQPYFKLGDDSSTIDPKFEINTERVRADNRSHEENAQVLNLVNWFSKSHRRGKYNQKKDDSNIKVKIISEGDSWFQYPILLKDVIDCLMDEDEFAILSFGEAGHLIKNMVASAEFRDDLITEQPDLFLISGGGNDLVENQGVKRFLISSQSDKPQAYINNKAVKDFEKSIKTHYQALFDMVIDDVPNIHIICHGYSYPVPRNGVWLGKPMTEFGITDEALQKGIIDLVFDKFNDAIKKVATEHSENVHYLDLKNVVPEDGWHDELHPNNESYRKVANIFKEKINTIFL